MFVPNTWTNLWFSSVFLKDMGNLKSWWKDFLLWDTKITFLCCSFPYKTLFFSAEQCKLRKLCCLWCLLDGLHHVHGTKQTVPLTLEHTHTHTQTDWACGLFNILCVSVTPTYMSTPGCPPCFVGVRAPCSSELICFLACPIHCPLVDRSQMCFICLYTMKANGDLLDSTTLAQPLARV